jgi:hypothetical protein
MLIHVSVFVELACASWPHLSLLGRKDVRASQDALIEIFGRIEGPS